MKLNYVDTGGQKSCSERLEFVNLFSSKARFVANFCIADQPGETLL